MLLNIIAEISRSVTKFPLKILLTSDTRNSIIYSDDLISIIHSPTCQIVVNNFQISKVPKITHQKQKKEKKLKDSEMAPIQPTNDTRNRLHRFVTIPAALSV